MKTRFLGIVAFAIAGLLCYSCGDDEEIGLPSSPTQPTTESKGLVTFVLSLADNSPVPTGTAPFVITTGDTLDMAISQTSSYTNPDGTVFTCEPKAYVKLFAQSDTLVAKDLQALTTVKELSVNTNEEKEAALTRHLTEQMFSVGGQIVTFNLSHEVYTYVNSQQESIEMPYIKVNPANYGSASADEKADGTHASAHLAGIRLKPIEPQTRGTLLTDTAMYEVTVAFNLDIKSVHTDRDGKQNLPFEVHFVALVESTTEVPDPVVEFSYLTKASEGTYSTVSPFVLAKGATSMTVDWEQQSSYTWFDLQRLEQCSISYGPQASITFSLAADTVTYSGTTEELNNATPSAIEEETIASESGSLHVARQTYALGGGQTIGITWAYESLSSQDVQGNQIALPYVALDSPELLGVTVTERPDISIPGKEAAVYEVTARFKQDVSSQNATNNESQSMEYVIKYMAVQEVKLVKVTYRKGWEWNTPHDNIILGYFARVYRDRTYSNGKTFTDTFGDMGHFISLTSVTDGFRFDWDKEDEFSWDGKKSSIILEMRSIRILFI